MRIRKKSLSLVLVFAVFWQMLFSTAAFSNVTFAANEGGIKKSATPLKDGKTTVRLQIDRNLDRGDAYDIVLIFDRTASMDQKYGEGKTPLVVAQEETKGFIDRVLKENDKNRIAIVSFSAKADKAIEFTNDATALKAYVDAIKASGETNIRAGLDAGSVLLDQSDNKKNRKVAILLTDGVPNTYLDPTLNNQPTTVTDYTIGKNTTANKPGPVDETNVDDTNKIPIEQTFIGAQLISEKSEYFAVSLFGALKPRTYYNSNYAGDATLGYFWDDTFAQSYVDSNSSAAYESKQVTFKENGRNYPFTVDVPVVTVPAGVTPTQGNKKKFLPAWWSEKELGHFVLENSTPNPQERYREIESLTQLFDIYRSLEKRITGEGEVVDYVPEDFVLDEASFKVYEGPEAPENLVKFDSASLKVVKLKDGRTEIRWKPNIYNSTSDILTYELKVQDKFLTACGKLATNQSAIFTYYTDLNTKQTEYFTVPTVTLPGVKPVITVTQNAYSDAARTKQVSEITIGEKLYYKTLINNETTGPTPIKFTSNLDLENVTTNIPNLSATFTNKQLNLGVVPAGAKIEILSEFTPKNTTNNFMHNVLAESNCYTASVTINSGIATNTKTDVPGGGGTGTGTNVKSDQGQVTVKHVDNVNYKEIPEVTPNPKVINGKVGTEYDEPKKDINGYKWVSTDGGPPVGKISETPITIRHVYAKEGEVEVKYFDKATDTFVDPVAFPLETVKVYSGQANNITYKQVPNYVFSSSKLNDEAKTTSQTVNVSYKNTKQTLIFYVEKVKNPVQIKVEHLEEGTNELIKADAPISAKEDDEVTITRLNDPKWTFVSGPEKVIAKKDLPTVKLYYKKNGVATEKHVDKFTNEVLLTKTKTGTVGTAYKFQEETITGYQYLNEFKGNKEGKLADTPTEVIFYYGKPTKKKVTYILKANNTETVLDTKEESAYVNEPYDYPTKYENYIYINASGETKGKVPTGGLDLKLYFKKNVAYVKTVHLDKDTKKSILPKELEPKAYEEGDDYTTDSVDVSNYRLLVEPDNKTGKVKEGTTVVTYLYVKRAKVITNFLNVDDKTKSVKERIVKEYDVGNQYEAKSETVPGFKYVSSDGDKVEGKVDANGAVVNHYYKEVIPTTEITVKYIDITDPNSPTGIKDYPTVVEAKPIKTSYEYPVKTIPTYRHVKTDGEIKGVVGEKSILIIFFYEKAKVSANVKYVEEGTGRQLLTSDTITGRIGDDYTTTPKGVSGYTLSIRPTNEKGKYEEKMSDIVYQYRRDYVPTPTPTPRGKVIVKHIDAKTKADIASAQTKEDYVGNSYDTSAVTVTDYKLVGTPGNAKGTYSSSDITVIYEYEKVVVNPAPTVSSVLVRYVDKATGTELGRQQLDSLSIGSDYKTESKPFAGYQLVEVPKNATGKVTASATTVVYEYNRLQGNVTVKYVDWLTKKELAPTYTFSGFYGADYATKQETFAGYKFRSATGELAGKFSEKPQVVTYYYDAKIKFPDDGGPIGGKPNDPYTVTVYYRDITTDKQLSRVVLSESDGPTFKTNMKKFSGYSFVKVVGKTSGTFTEKPQTVTYYYKATKATSEVTPPTGGSDTGIHLPVTGEMIPWMNYIVGAVMMMAAVVLFARKRRTN